MGCVQLIKGFKKLFYTFIQKIELTYYTFEQEGIQVITKCFRQVLILIKRFNIN